MRRVGRYLECIACFDCAGRLTLYGKLEAAFQDIGGLDSRMRVSPDGHSSLDCRFHKYRHIARHRTVCLRQNLSREAARRWGRRTLSRRCGCNKLGNSADRAGRKTRESSPCQHNDLPDCVPITSARTFLTQVVSLSRLGWQGERLGRVITGGLVARRVRSSPIRPLHTRDPHRDRLPSPGPDLARLGHGAMFAIRSLSGGKRTLSKPHSIGAGPG